MFDIKSMIERDDTSAGNYFDMFLQVLIVTSIISFSINTLPNLHPRIHNTCRAIEVVTVIIFTIEYLLRLLTVDKKRNYIFSFFGLIDLFSILPFYLMVGLDLRTLRIFRLLKLVRIFKLARYNNAAKRFHKAFLVAKEEVTLLLITMFLALYIAGVGIYYFEHQAQPEVFGSIFSGLWWAVSSLTTVGYGDIYPITIGGKIFTFFVLIIGLGVIAIPAGLFASALSQVRKECDVKQ